MKELYNQIKKINKTLEDQNKMLVEMGQKMDGVINNLYDVTDKVYDIERALDRLEGKQG